MDVSIGDAYSSALSLSFFDTKFLSPADSLLGNLCVRPWKRRESFLTYLRVLEESAAIKPLYNVNHLNTVW